MAESTLSSESKPLDEKTEAELKREAKARLRLLSPVAAAQVVGETVRDSASKPATGFVAFLRERAIVGLAIGFVIGAQVQQAAKVFISGFVDPLFKLLIPGNQTLSDRAWTLRLHSHTASFAWGSFAYQLLDLLFLIIIIYLVIRLFKLDRLDAKK